MSALVPAAKTESARKHCRGEIIAGVGQQRVGPRCGRRPPPAAPCRSPMANQVAWKSTSVPSLSNRIALDRTANDPYPARNAWIWRTRPAVEASLVAASSLPSTTGSSAGRQFLAEFDAPLVEGVDAEQLRLDEDAVLVERDQPAERLGVELVGRGWSPTGRLPGKTRCGAILSTSAGFMPLASIWRLAPPPACGPSSAPPTAPGSWRAAGRGDACSSGSWPLRRGQELDRDDVGALVQQLEEGVLAVGAGLAPDQRAGRRRHRRRRRCVTRLPFDSMSSCCR